MRIDMRFEMRSGRRQMKMNNVTSGEEGKKKKEVRYSDIQIFRCKIFKYSDILRTAIEIQYGVSKPWIRNYISPPNRGLPRILGIYVFRSVCTCHTYQVMAAPVPVPACLPRQILRPGPRPKANLTIIQSCHTEYRVHTYPQYQPSPFNNHHN
jgi:hypothetical protein